MTTAEIERHLLDHDIKPTPNRILVLKTLAAAIRPVNLAYIEEELATMDKASIFRVLELLAQHDVVHVIEDGSRSLKYEMCHSGGQHSVADQHVHFYCENCHEIFCLNNATIPAIELPAGFVQRSVNFVIKGICQSCSRE